MIFTKLYGYIAAFAGIVLGAIGLYFKGKSEGKTVARAEAVEQSAEQMIEDIELKREVTEDAEEFIADASIDERIDSL